MTTPNPCNFLDPILDGILLNIECVHTSLNDTTFLSHVFTLNWVRATSYRLTGINNHPTAKYYAQTLEMSGTFSVSSKGLAIIFVLLNAMFPIKSILFLTEMTI